jgi:hypothetical protein
METYQFAYLAGAVFWFLIWLTMVVIWPEQRSVMIWSGLLLGGAGPVSEYWFLQDYWHPVFILEIELGSWRFGFEDWLSTLAIAGICTGVFERLALARGYPALSPINWRGVARLLGYCLAGLILMWVLADFAKLGSLSSLLIAIFSVACWLLAAHRHLAPLSIGLAVVAGVAYWLFYAVLFVPLFPGVFDSLWKPEALSGVELYGVPVEEFVWVSVSMLFVGPLFRVCFPPTDGADSAT